VVVSSSECEFRAPWYLEAIDNLCVLRSILDPSPSPCRLTRKKLFFEGIVSFRGNGDILVIESIRSTIISILHRYATKRHHISQNISGNILQHAAT